MKRSWSNNGLTILIIYTLLHIHDKESPEYVDPRSLVQCFLKISNLGDSVSDTSCTHVPQFDLINLGQWLHSIILGLDNELSKAPS